MDLGLFYALFDQIIITAMIGNIGITQDYQATTALTNGFNKDEVQRELDVQVQVTQSFDQNRREVRTQYAKKAEAYRKEAEKLPQGSQERTDLEAKAKQIDDNLRLFDGITSALYAPNSNGIIGDVARAVSPQVAYQIGQYFKDNELKNQSDGGNRPEEQSPQHLLAHAILGAATSYATGNDIATGALSGATSEKAAPILATYLYGKDTKDLTQEQKDTITSIISLGSAGIAYGTTNGSMSDAVSASEVGKVGVENNTLKKSDADELLRQIAYARRHYDGAKLDEEMRRIRSLSAELANENFKEIQACQNNPTPSCVNKIKSEYKDVNFAGLQDAYREYQGTHTILSGYESRNNSLLSCADTNFADCIIAADGKKVMLEGAYAAIGGGIGKGVGTSAQQVKQIKSQGGSKTNIVEPDSVSSEREALKRIAQNQKNTTDLSVKPSNTILSSKLVKDLKSGKFPGKADKLGAPREMPKTSNPSQTAENFAIQFLGRKPTQAELDIGAKMNKGKCAGCWNAQKSDGTWVTYRPAGQASDKTDVSTATVELNSTEIKNINKNNVLKLKFPKE